MVACVAELFLHSGTIPIVLPVSQRGAWDSYISIGKLSDTQQL